MSNFEGHIGKRRYQKRDVLRLESLEQRVLLDASGLISDLTTQDAVVADFASGVADRELLANREIVFVDTTVEDYQTLLLGVDRNAEVVLLDADRDGMEQIVAALQGRADVSAIHLVAHGEQAELHLGKSVLTATSMLGQHAAALAAIGSSLSADADILVYGCDFGKGELGEEAAQRLAQLTGSDVAASDDLTGSQQLGGDWDLEVHIGAVDTPPAFSAAARQHFASVLAGSPVPTATVNVPKDEMINQDFQFSLTFDNTAVDPNHVGYAPYIDMSIPPGIDINSASYLGANVTMTTAGIFNAGGVLENGGNPVNHPITNLPVAGGNAGETLYVIEMPFGSFVPDQTPATVTIDAASNKANGAVAEVPMTITATGGFALGCDPLANPGSDPPIQGSAHTDVFTPLIIDLMKESDAPEDERSTGPNFEVTYTLTVDIANGETVTDLDITDALPNSFVYLPGTLTVNSASATAASGMTITAEPVAGSPQNAPNNNVLVEFSSVTGSLATDDIIVEYTIYVDEFDADNASVLAPTSGDDVLVVNDAEVIANYETGPVGDNDAQTDEQLEQQSIAIQKGVTIVNDTGGAEATPGDTLEYTMHIQVSDYFEFSLVQIDDTFSDGQLWDTSFTPTFSINEDGVNTSGNFAPANFSVTHNSPGDGSTDVHFDLFAEVPDGVLTGDEFGDGMIDAGGTTATIRYRTVIQEQFTDTFPSGDASVDTGDILSNAAIVSGILPSGQAETDDTAAAIEIEGPVIAKEIYAIDGDLGLVGEDIVAGHTITYRLTFSMPTADFENLVITDFLPLPIYDATEIVTLSNTPTATAPPAGTLTYGPLHDLHLIAPSTNPPSLIVDGVANTVQLDFDDFDVDPSVPAVIDFMFTVTAQDVLMADNLYLTNQANAEFDSTNNGIVSSDAIVQNQVAAPELSLTKGIVSTTSAAATFMPATVGPVVFADPASGAAFAGGIDSANLATSPINSNLVNADAGDLVKFAIVVENQGGADGFDVLIQDSLPAEYLVPASGLNLQVVDGDGNNLTFSGAPGDLFTSGIRLDDTGGLTGSINDLDDATAAGDGSNIAVITYDLELAIDVSPDQVYTNTAAIAEFGAVEGGNDHTVGSSDPDWMDIATIEVANVVPTKTLVSTSETHTSGNDVAIGEIVRYRVAAEIPEGTMNNLQFDDNLPDDMQFINDGTATVAFVSNAGIVSNDISGALNLAVPAGANQVGNSPLTPTFPLSSDNIGSDGSTATDPDSYGNSTDPRFKFGQIINADDDHDAEYIVVEFNALVMNASGQNNGDSLSNTVGVIVNGTTEATSGPLTVTVREPAITNVTKTTAPGTADAGDTVAFQVTFSNTGATNAYEVNLLDSVPSDYTLDLASISIALANGAAGLTDNSVGNDVAFRVDDMPVGGSVTVNYEATLLGSVQPGEVLQNTALVSYTGLPGANGTTTNPTGSSNTGTPGADDGERDAGIETHNDYSDSSTGNVTVAAPTTVKTLVATSINGPNNANNEAVIGESVQYEVVVTIPEGTTNAAQIVDTLDAGLSFVSLDSIATSAAISSDNVALDLNNAATITPGVSGQTVTLSLGQLTNSNTDNGVDETITVRYTALVENVVTNQGEAAGTQLNNSATFAWTHNGTPASTSAAQAPEIAVIEPDLDINKSINTATIDAGDSVTYTIVIGHNANSDTDAFDVIFTDPVPSAITWNYPADVTATHSSAGNILGDFEQAGDILQTVAGSTFDLLSGETVTLTITGVIGGGVTPGQQLVNTATIDWTSIDGANVGERDGSDGATGTPNDYEASSTAVVTAVVNPGMVKQLISTSINNANNDDSEVVIGETAQYRVTVTIPEATLPAAQLIDNLDLGLEFLSLDSVTAFSNGTPTADLNSSIGAFGTTSLFAPAVVGNGITTPESLTFDFGTLTNTNNDNAAAETLELVYTVRTTNSAANNSNGSSAGTILDNSATFGWEDGGGTPFTLPTVDAADIEVIEPELDIAVVIDDDTPHLGQTVTYTLTVTHTGNSDADAQNLVITDLVPALMSLDLSSFTINGAAVAANNSAGNNVAFEFDSLPLGDTITITYQATVTTDANQVGANLDNTANATWTSLPDGTTNGPGPERDGDTGNAGEDDYNELANETAVLTHPFVELTKTQVGNPTPAASNIEGNWDVTYDLEVTNTGNDPLTQMSLMEDVATQYGGGFVRIVPQAGSPATITNSTATDEPELNAAYDGGQTSAELFDNSGGATNNLAPGQVVSVRMVIEIDPNDPAAIYTPNGDFQNQATVDSLGQYSGLTVSDLSDDPFNTDDEDGRPFDPTDDDGNPDDPNLVRFPQLSLTKTLVGAPVPASSGARGNYDATYLFLISNTGSTELDLISLTEDFASQFGGAFVRIVPFAGSPAVITGSTALSNPVLNPNYDGGITDDRVFAGTSGLMAVDNVIAVRIVAEIDPDSPTAIYDGLTGDGNGDLENQAYTSGNDFLRPSGSVTVTDASDDPNDPTNVDGDPSNPGDTSDDDSDPDDPTVVSIGELDLLKEITSIVPSTSGVNGHFDVTYVFTMTNTGGRRLNNLQLDEDFVAHYGGAFTGLLGAPNLVAGPGAVAPNLSAYDGGQTAAGMFDGTSGELDPGEFLTVTLMAEVNFASPTAIYNANDDLENSAVATGLDPNSLVVSDVSDDPTDATDVDPNSDNNPDDPTVLTQTRIDLVKRLVSIDPAASGISGNFDLSYTFTLQNQGTKDLTNLTLVDDWNAQFGGMFVGIVGSAGVTNVNATIPPSANPAYVGGTQNMLDGSGLLEAGQLFDVTLTVEVDADADPSSLIGPLGLLENSAVAAGDNPAGDTVTDVSDDPTNPANVDPNGDQSPDDPTYASIADIDLRKTIDNVAPAASGVIGNVDVDYTFTVTNTGALTLSLLTLTDDFASQYGGAFVGLVGLPNVTPGPGAVAPTLDGSFNGNVNANLFDGASGELNSGEFVTVTLTAEVNADAPSTIFNAAGFLENSATTSGRAGNGSLVTDISDDTSNVTDVDPNSDNNPDDPTALLLPSDPTVGVSKAGAYTSVDTIVFDFYMEHFGDAWAVNLSLPDDLDAVFGAGNYTVTAPVLVSGTSSVVPNAAFNGSGDVELLDPTSNMMPGDTAQLQVVVTVTNMVDTQANGLGVYDNAVILSGAGISGQPFTDPSTDGMTPDAAGNGTLTRVVGAIAEINGFVYSDANANSTFDNGESGILGVEIQLTGTDLFGGPISQTTFTDVNGFYSFEDLFPGTYTITEIQPTQFLDGGDQIGTLGGTSPQNDQFTVTIQPGEVLSADNNFGESGLRPEFISKATLLASTPNDYWANLNAGGVQALWYSFEATTSGAVEAILVNADSIEVDIFDQNMRPLNQAAGSETGATWVIHEGQRYAVRLSGPDESFDLALAFDDDVDLPVDLDVQDNVVVAVATSGDDHIELILGAQTHLLIMADYRFEFDAQLIDTFHIGGSTGENAIRVQGTGANDVAKVLDNHGEFSSDAYAVHTYSFSDIRFDGMGGYDRSEVYGSNADDSLSGLPHDSTLTTPDRVSRMENFERVDSFGRGGNDYASLFGTLGDDNFYTFDTYEVLTGPDAQQTTKGFERVDVFGRSGNDTANLFDTAGDDHFWDFGTYSVMSSPHLHAVVKGFEATIATANKGGTDTAHVRALTSSDVVSQTNDALSITGPDRNVEVRGFEDRDVEQIALDPANLPATVEHQGVEYRGIQKSNGSVVFAADSGAVLNLGVTFASNGNQFFVTGTAGDDSVEVVFGSETHVVSIIDYDIHLAASAFSTVKVAGNGGQDEVLVVGTEADDVGYVLEGNGQLSSGEYQVQVVDFANITFDGNHGNDRTQIYGSNGADVLSGLPSDSTLQFSTGAVRMLDFERVDAFGRGGHDVASLYGTLGDDTFYTFDTYEVLTGAGMKQTTKGFERVNAYGRAGADTAQLFDSQGDDEFWDFGGYSAMVSSHLYAVVKGFEETNAVAENGGNDKAYVRQLVTADRLFAQANIAAITGPTRNTHIRGFDSVDVKHLAGETPTRDVSTVDYLLSTDGDWL